MTARNRDKTFELVTLKERPLVSTASSESAFPGTNMPNEIYAPVLHRDGQLDELNRKSPVSGDANVCYGSKEILNVNSSSIADGCGYCNTIKVPCFKTAFYFLVVIVGIVAVLTVLATTGLILVVLSKPELRKTERELDHKLILVTLTVDKLSSQISEQYKEIMQNFASVYNTTNYNAVATDIQKTNVDAIQTKIRHINDQVTQIGRKLSDLDSTINITALEIVANDASNKVNMLVGENLISNCTSRKLQSNEFVQDMTSAISMAITGVLYLTVSIYIYIHYFWCSFFFFFFVTYLAWWRAVY